MATNCHSRSPRANNVIAPPRHCPLLSAPAGKADRHRALKHSQHCQSLSSQSHTPLSLSLSPSLFFSLSLSHLSRKHCSMALTSARSLVENTHTCNT